MENTQKLLPNPPYLDINSDFPLSVLKVDMTDHCLMKV